MNASDAPAIYARLPLLRLLAELTIADTILLQQQKADQVSEKLQAGGKAATPTHQNMP
jgi:hypothetical protein